MKGKGETTPKSGIQKNNSNERTQTEKKKPMKYEYKGYELLTEKCLKTHKLLFHGDQKFEEGHRPIEHRCTLEKGKLTCRNLIETNREGLPKYMDEGGRAYQDIESF